MSAGIFKFMFSNIIMYDSIYSYIVTENPTVIIDMLENCVYYNRECEIIIIMQVNSSIFEELNLLISKSNKLNPAKIIMRKVPDMSLRKNTFSLLEGHLENFRHCKYSAINGKYFIPLLDNCLFVDHITIEKLNHMHLNRPDITQAEITEEVKNFIAENTKLETYLNNAKISNIYSGQFIGMTIEIEIIHLIASYIYSKKIKDVINHHSDSANILIPTLYSHYSSKISGNICSFVYDCSAPDSIDALCIADVDLNYMDPLRTHIRNNMNKLDIVIDLSQQDISIDKSPKFLINIAGNILLCNTLKKTPKKLEKIVEKENIVHQPAIKKPTLSYVNYRKLF